MWLSTAGDDTSLSKLTLLNNGKMTPGNDPQFVQLDKGEQVYVTDFTSTRCHEGKVFVTIQVKDGNHKGIDGWVCGASTTHRKVAAL